MKRLFFNICFALLLGGSSLCTIVAQTPVQKLSTYVKSIAAFNYLCPQEKVYVHTDNNGYFMGETIWFNVYLVTSSQHLANSPSKVVYVELLSPEGELVDTRKVEMVNGRGHGDFLLDKLLGSGYYEIRAYTRSMLNWGDDILFSRVFPIFEAPQKEGEYSAMVINERSYSQRVPDVREPRTEDKMKKINVGFFPEGGHCVMGLTCKVAFEVTDKEGRAVDATGFLQDSKGSRVAALSTLYQGRGFFEYKPDGGSYKVILTVDGKDYDFDVPGALPQGYTLSLNPYVEQKIQLMVQKSSDVQAEPLGISLMNRGNLFFFDTLNVSSGEASLSLARADLPVGVNQVTLFNTQGEVLAERLFFVPPTHTPAVVVKQSKSSYRALDPIILDMQLKDAAGAPIKTTFSMAVRDRDSESNGCPDNIVNYLLLSSDLKGYINNPSYYFESDDRKHRMAADLLTLVQGWRRYEWQTMAGIKPFTVKQPVEEGLLIDGAVLSTGRKLARAGVQLDATLYTLKGASMKGSCVTDSAGRFAFYPQPFYDQWTMIMKTSVDGKPKDHRITLNRGFSPASRPYSPYAALHHEVNLPAADSVSTFMWKDTLPARPADVHELSTVEINARRKQKARMAWESEERGMRVANLYYNVEREVQKSLDAGESPTDIYTWLVNRNPYFNFSIIPHYEMASVLNPGTRLWIAQQGSIYRNDQLEGDRMYDNEKKVALKDKSATSVSDEESQKISSNYEKAIADGEQRNFFICTYKGRRVILVVNNRYMDQERDGDAYCNIAAEDVKSVIISEEESPLSNFDIPDVDKNREHVIVFIYLQPNRSLDAAPKGVRRTYFEGYSTPKEFYSPNYRELPPQADYRRTLYWNPAVKSDSTGHASALFFNNSTGRQIVVTIEGIAPDGTPFYLER